MINLSIAIDALLFVFVDVYIYIQVATPDARTSRGKRISSNFAGAGAATSFIPWLMRCSHKRVLPS